MKSYIADTNMFLRFWINDHKDHHDKAEAYIKLAQSRKIEIIVINEVVFELEYLLRKFYKYNKDVIVSWLSKLVTTEFFEIEDRDIWMRILVKYEKLNIDLTDLFLYEKSVEMDIEVLSFDKDFEKLKKLA